MPYDDDISDVLARRRAKSANKPLTLIVFAGGGLAVLVVGVLVAALLKNRQTAGGAATSPVPTQVADAGGGPIPFFPIPGGGAKPTVPATPVPGSATLNPAAAGVLNHPWWRGKVTAAGVENVLREVQNVSEAVVLFDQTGDVSTMARAGRAKPGWFDVLSASNERSPPAIKGEWGDCRYIVVGAPAGTRVGRKTAQYLLEDAFRLKSFREWRGEADDNMRKFIEAGGRP